MEIPPSLTPLIREVARDLLQANSEVVYKAKKWAMRYLKTKL
jgi:hypothetical protein